MYCFEYKFKSRLENDSFIEGFAINDYKFEDVLYGVNKAFISRSIMHRYKLDGGLIKSEMPIINTINKLSFNKVLTYYDDLVRAVEYSKKPNNAGLTYSTYVQHCKDYKHYYEKIVELMQLIIAKWDDWN